ncbi:MAG: diguanylate cyclase [Phycisphaerae bacterium]|nr:diguanylate cyclase [Phycisphaerae bacterium]
MFENSDVLYILLDNLQEGVYLVDAERRITYWNKGAERISGFTSQEVLGKRCSDNVLIHVDGDGNLMCGKHCPLMAAIQDGGVRSGTHYLRHKEGHRLPVHVTAAPISDADGKVIGAVETFYDKSSVMAALGEIEELNRPERLCQVTGVGNREYAEQFLKQRLIDARQDGTHVGLLVIDVDDYDKLVHSYGQNAGHIVLKMVARTAMGPMRSCDFLGRWDVARFLAALPGVTPSKLYQVAQQLRVLVQQSSRTLSKGRLFVTVSVGGCVCDPYDTIDHAVAQAEDLACTHTTDQRNRVRISEDVPRLPRSRSRGQAENASTPRDAITQST